MKIAIIIYGVLLLAVFLLPIFDGVHNAGTLVGSAFGAVTLVLGVNYLKFDAKGRELVPVLLAVVTMVALFFMDGVYHQSKSRKTDAKAVIVLGCRVRGLEPSKALKKRVDKAFTVLSICPDIPAILSGGQGSDELISEAECMKNMLAERGIPESRLILENRSTSTDENLRFSKELMKKEGIDGSVYLVTSDYHQKRALMLCKKYGIDAAPQSSKTKPLHLPTFLLREIMGLVKDRIL